MFSKKEKEKGQKLKFFQDRLCKVWLTNTCVADRRVSWKPVRLESGKSWREEAMSRRRR